MKCFRNYKWLFWAELIFRNVNNKDDMWNIDRSEFVYRAAKEEEAEVEWKECDLSHVSAIKASNKTMQMTSDMPIFRCDIIKGGDGCSMFYQRCEMLRRAICTPDKWGRCVGRYVEMCDTPVNGLPVSHFTRRYLQSIFLRMTMLIVFVSISTRATHVYRIAICRFKL